MAEPDRKSEAGEETGREVPRYADIVAKYRPALADSIRRLLAERGKPKLLTAKNRQNTMDTFDSVYEEYSEFWDAEDVRSRIDEMSPNRDTSVVQRRERIGTNRFFRFNTSVFRPRHEHRNIIPEKESTTFAIDGDVGGRVPGQIANFTVTREINDDQWNEWHLFHRQVNEDYMGGSDEDNGASSICADYMYRFLQQVSNDTEEPVNLYLTTNRPQEITWALKENEGFALDGPDEERKWSLMCNPPSESGQQLLEMRAEQRIYPYDAPSHIGDGFGQGFSDAKSHGFNIRLVKTFNPGVSAET